MKKKSLEILAPAKDKKCAISAINYGADAIYTGTVSFGARKNASNTLDDIKQMVQYAHKFWAKVYVTINTILTDTELQDAQKLLDELYKIGADGIIVQDFGIFELKLPPFKIIASTQCDTRDKDRVEFFESIGLQRVIVARELSLDDIKQIGSDVNIEIEAFVHGALCVCYSGQCYLSCALGGRSANRGECAQACRRRFTLVDENQRIIAKDKHLLNLKDFCALNHIDDLIKAGVSSFKIEGRLKDENYVKNVVAAYSKALLGKKRCSSGTVFYDFEPNVNKSFNRGFSAYLLTKENNGDIFNFETPKSTGEYLGEVCSVSKNSFEIKTRHNLKAQDGLCFLSGGGALVNKCEKTSSGFRVYPNKMPQIVKGEKVYRNFDAEFEKTLLNSKTKRRIRASISVFEDKIEALDEDKNLAVVEFDTKEFANDSGKMTANFKTQLQKTGESDFWIDKINFQCENVPFLKISQINELRRTLFEKLIDERFKNYKNQGHKGIEPSNFPLKDNDYRLNVHNKKALDFYKKRGVNCTQKSFESSSYVKGAELMRTKHCLRRAFNMCTKLSDTSAKKLFLIDEKGKKLKLEFDCKNCEMIIK